MHAVWMRARSELRSRLGAILVLALIAGTLGGVVIAAAAGAERTDTAYPRFLAAKNALDLEIDANAKTKAAAERVLAKIARLPQVAMSAQVAIASGIFDLPHVRQAGTGSRAVFRLVSPTGGWPPAVTNRRFPRGRSFGP